MRHLTRPSLSTVRLVAYRIVYGPDGALKPSFPCSKIETIPHVCKVEMRAVTKYAADSHLCALCIHWGPRISYAPSRGEFDLAFNQGFL